MIVIVAGNSAVGARVGHALAQQLPQAAVVRPDYFVPAKQDSSSPEDCAGNGQGLDGAPWLAGTLAASANSIAAHGGTCIVVLPRFEDVSSVYLSLEHISAPLFLFLLDRPASTRGFMRRAVTLTAKGRDVAEVASEILALSSAGKGLLRPAPSSEQDASVLPADYGPSTGVDIIEIPRIAHVVERYGERFLRRVYTEAEQTLYRGRIPELAARFAAKEAISKALGTGIWGIRWREMEVLPDVRGKPLVYLHGAAAARARALNLRHFAVSLSHSREFAMAVVVAT